MRFENREGQQVPNVEFKILVDGALKSRSSEEIFKGRNVIVFSLPGAFTPTCSSQHVPRYNELASVFAKHGVDEIICISVNDAFVMGAWHADQDAENVTFLADGNGEFTRDMGLLVNKDELGFGDRSWRYSMLVKDGIIAKQFIEPDVPGDPYEVSDADTMLSHIAPDAQRSHDILLLTRQGCSHCARAKAALREAGLAYEDVPATPAVLRAVSDTPTTPRVFIDGKLIGGADELATWLAQH